MTAQIGEDGLDLLGDPLPKLLTDVAGVQPQPGRDWVHLKDKLGFRSTQRLVIREGADGVVVATWPTELAEQARYLYGGGLGSALVAAAIERGWTVIPSPHIPRPSTMPAIRNSPGPRSANSSAPPPPPQHAATAKSHDPLDNDHRHNAEMRVLRNRIRMHLPVWRITRRTRWPAGWRYALAADVQTWSAFGRPEMTVGLGEESG
jgi:hypothetical protein